MSSNIIYTEGFLKMSPDLKPRNCSNCKHTWYPRKVIYKTKEGLEQLEPIRCPKCNSITYKKLRLYRNKEWFYNLYINYGKSIEYIAKVQDITRQTAYNWLKRHNIRRR